MGEATVRLCEGEGEGIATEEDKIDRILWNVYKIGIAIMIIGWVVWGIGIMGMINGWQ